MSLFCHTESCTERELTHLSQAPVWDPLFRGEAGSQCPKLRPWKTIWAVPQGQRSVWGCGSGSPHGGLLGHRDTGRWNPAAPAQCSELQTAATPSPVLVTPWGQLQCDICDRTPPSVSLGGWRNAVRRCGNQRGPRGLGSHPTLAPSASFLWHLVCKQICASHIGKLAKIISAHSAAGLGLCLFLQFQTIQGRQNLQTQHSPSQTTKQEHRDKNAPGAPLAKSNAWVLESWRLKILGFLC